MPFHHHSFQPVLKSNLNSSERTFYNLSKEITYFPINPLLSPLCLYQSLFYTFLVHYSYGCNICAHDDELWGPSPEQEKGRELISAQGFIQLSHPPVLPHSHQYNKPE